MNKFLLLICFFSVIIMEAQISITSTNMPVSGDTCRFSKASLTSLGDYISSGPNWVWDFSTLDSTGQDVRKFVPSSATPYSIYFYAKFGEKTMDSVPIPAIPGMPGISMKNIYSFYRKNGAASFNSEGLGITISGAPVGSTAQGFDYDELYLFPLNYMDHDSTTFRFSTPSFSAVPFAYKKHGYRITDVDGYGTITTPYGTEACIRVVTTQYATDTIIINAIPAPFNKISFPNHVRSYQWLTLTEKIPYLEITGNMVFGNFVPTQARYKDKKRNFVGIKEEELNLMLSVFPNPSTNEITIITPKLDGTVDAQITDLSGKNVLQKTLTENPMIANRHSLDVSSLAKGFYILNLSNNSGKQSLKISIQ
ncbi:MAG: hypothetical protein K0R26_2232 [Bacteroidota bacterium]|nr:hypothetical protein [Bacteroidota bacterium]